MFAAATALSSLKSNDHHRHQIHILESTSRTMTKVSLSGGGRCNVLHDTTKPLPVLLDSYPRGSRELTGLMTKRFGPELMERWFRERGVVLKTEEDGRMFPVTDSSETIVECIRNACGVDGGGVVVRTGEKVSDVLCEGGRFVVTLGGDNSGRRGDLDGKKKEGFDCIILATGSSPGGHAIASSLGHNMVPPVPSLFTLNAKLQVKEGGVLNGLSGLSVQMAEVTLKISG